MNREIFQEHLLRAAESAVIFARKYALNDLPDQVVFLVHPNQSCDENPRRGDEETYPEDTQKDDQPLTFRTAEAVVGYLWRNEKVPEWIDINVGGEDGDHTYLRLLCCGRFTATVELLYHRDGNIPPFSVKSPVFSPGYDDTPEAESQKFDVNWQEKAKREFKRLQETENNLGHRLLRTVRSLIGGQ
jgi:hypothetical protein